MRQTLILRQVLFPDPDPQKNPLRRYEISGGGLDNETTGTDKLLFPVSALWKDVRESFHPEGLETTSVPNKQPHKTASRIR